MSGFRALCGDKMKKWDGQSGLSLVETLVSAFMLVAVFSGVFYLMTKSRASFSAMEADGHHMHFETFASSRLRLYFSKIMQWTTHLAGESDDNDDWAKKAFKDYCKFTSNFAYSYAPLDFPSFASEDKEKAKCKDGVVVKNADGSKVYEEDADGDPVFDTGEYPCSSGETGPVSKSGYVWLNKAEIPYRTLAADVRMSLSTLNYAQATTGDWKTTGLLDKYDRSDFLWGAMIPFSSGGLSSSSNVDSLWRANPNLAKFCSDTNYRPAKGIGEEMCRWVDWCSGQNRSVDPEPTSEPSETRKILQYATADSQSINELYGSSTFRMCFVFAGNLFSKSGDLYAADSESSLGLNSVENPANLGLAVATARFMDSRTADKVLCEDSIFNMHRSMKVRLNLYSVSSADKKYSTKKQNYKKTVKEFTAEKLGIDRPNCRNKRQRRQMSVKNASGLPVCIADPLFHYVCSEDDDCGEPDP
ncbi:MAG: hypothetical protein RIR26_1859 [Pseudomonadota bacterium]